jgi:hypothetical protein
MILGDKLLTLRWFCHTKEVVWIRNFVSELAFVPSASSPINLYCDNSGVIMQAKEPRSHKKAKHVL